MDSSFFGTVLELLKLFKNDHTIYEAVFDCLSCKEYSQTEGEAVKKLKFPIFLVDKVWIKPEWSRFALYVLRFVEKLVDNGDILSLLKQGVSTVRLVASIINFVNEKDYKEFELFMES